MRRPMRVLAAGGVSASLALAMVTLSTVASDATTFHGVAQLIDTDVVAGAPQGASAVTSVQSDFGLPSNRSSRVPPSVTAEPSSETVTAGTTASFSAAASGSPTPSVEWAVSTNGGKRWALIRGATSTTYAFTATSSENGYEFEAIFSNAAGSATTAAASLTVTAASQVAPVITSNPANATVSAGATASFSASASGSPTPIVQWEVSTNGGTSFSPVSGGTSNTYSFVATAANNGNEFEAVFTNSVNSATTTAATLSVTTALAQSSNWSGYADPSSTFSAVNATWIVPTLSCTSRSSSYSSEWVGIDGWSSSTVEQDGTEADCLGGSPSYYAWYEMYGDSAVNSGDEVELSPATNPIAPGDSLSASVSEVSGTTWTLALSDASTTHPWTFSTQITFASAALSSAEWIVERPEICSRTCTLTSLADFGTVTLSNAAATSTAGIGTISSSADTGVEMVNGSTLLAVPGPLDTAGDSFLDTWKAS